MTANQAMFAGVFFPLLSGGVELDGVAKLMKTNGPGASFVFGKENGWHPAGMRTVFLSLTGGVALLNDRLIAVNPAGVKEGWELWEAWGWTADELLGSL